MIRCLTAIAALAATLTLSPSRAAAQAAPPSGAPDAAEPPAGPPPSTIFFESRTIIVTVRPPPRSEEEARALGAQAELKCVRADRIHMGTMLDPRTVLLQLRSGDQLRVTLAQDCPVIGYYGGFYVSRQADKLCAGRDFLLARSGQRCVISEINRMRPQLVKAGQTRP